ncbi:hypothetical protein VRU48_15875 [Pedobacter sp. KR3-3]|uniref:Uncharacterized protein n=1 Tax=Pedobacter albus TaxID=3113905 RepID=A0ABU7IAV4_9SPHI|nr:hypothetical protein [Pedobacter sp. KR3-3]MEE1946605.1 hypothetical protein [Pedobacter sp. KR3-3]
MKKYILVLVALWVTSVTLAQNKPQTNSPSPKVSFNGKTCDALIAKLVDPNDYQGVELAGIGAGDMLKAKGKKPTGMNVNLKKDAKVMNMAEFFDSYKVPAANQEVIKVNGVALKIRENFLASKTMIGKVDFGKDAAGKPFTNITTTNNKTIKK